MNEIYKQKAEKYKNKYLKLKQELYGGDNQYNDCMVSPPILFNNEILKNIEDEYFPDPTNTNININSFNDDNHIGRLLKSKTKKSTISKDIFKTEIDNFKIIIKNKIIDKTYIPQIKYACKIININKSLFNYSNAYNILHKFFPNCNKSKISSKYGYIISTNPGKSIENDMEISDLIIFINNLINAIIYFIKPLHNVRYILNNIDFYNIKYDEKKVYFNISEMTVMTDNNKNNDIKNLINCIKNFKQILYKDYINKKLNIEIFDADILILILRKIMIDLNEIKSINQAYSNKKTLIENLIIIYDENNGLLNKITSDQFDKEVEELLDGKAYYDEDISKWTRGQYDNKLKKVMTKEQETKRKEYIKKLNY
jgi:hypothetical protein